MSLYGNFYGNYEKLIKQSENILSGLMREVFEETGLTLSSEDIKSMNMSHENKRFFCGEFKEIKSFVSNKYWKHKVEDNAYVIMRSKKNIIAMIHSTATQWQHQFRIEITLEKAQINLSGILSGSKTYGQEKIEIQPKFLKNKKSKIIKFKKDLSWEKEIKEYISCVKSNKKIYNGTIYDAIEVMKMIDIIYKSDVVWKKKFFNN